MDIPVRIYDEARDCFETQVLPLDGRYWSEWHDNLYCPDGGGCASPVRFARTDGTCFDFTDGCDDALGPLDDPTIAGVCDSNYGTGTLPDDHPCCALPSAPSCID